MCGQSTDTEKLVDGNWDEPGMTDWATLEVAANLWYTSDVAPQFSLTRRSRNQTGNHQSGISTPRPFGPILDRNKLEYLKNEFVRSFQLAEALRARFCSERISQNQSRAKLTDT
jgi:hypothetical protein